MEGCSQTTGVPELVAHLPGGSAALHTGIDPQDEMYLTILNTFKSPLLAETVYLRQGAEILNMLRQVADWKFGRLANVPRILDFASGYGRFTRHLIREVPPARVWVSDIYPGAVAFQQREFGVNGFVSVTDPADLPDGGRFDLILVSSLFTHLPEHRFDQWLARLHRRLTPSGLLAFSVHDETTPGALAAAFRFHPISESRSLDTAEYGCTFATAEYVRLAIERVIGPRWAHHRVPRALCGFQDLYLVTADRDEDFSAFRYRYGLQGYVEVAGLSADNVLSLSGWAGDPNEGADVAEVQALLGGELLATAPVRRPRADVACVLGIPKFGSAGWSLKVPVSVVRSSDILEVCADSGSGARVTLLRTAAAALRAACGVTRQLNEPEA